MKISKVLELEKKILSNDVSFLNIITGIMQKNNIIYSDNYGNLTEEEKEAILWLEPFMQLLYKGSKHSTGKLCESGFSRVVIHNNLFLKFTYYSGPDTFVSIEKINDVEGIKHIVTFALLRERLFEAEMVKSELAPIIQKYLKAGLTFEEITRMFVEIMRENRVKV